MFDQIQKFLPKTANKWGIGKEFQAIKICKEAEKVLAELFPNYNPENIQVKHFKEGRLVIAAKSSSWSQEISMKKDQIIKDVNSRLAKKLVKDLRTILKS